MSERPCAVGPARSWGALAAAFAWRASAGELRFSAEYRRGTELERSFPGCWQLGYTFERCCHTYQDMARLGDDADSLPSIFLGRILDILEGRRNLAGNPTCFEEGSKETYERCCSLNADYGQNVHYGSVFRVLLTPWAKITVVQGAALDNYMDPNGKGVLPRKGPIPYQGVQSGDGEGLAWSTGVRAAMALAQLDLSGLLNSSARRGPMARLRFLEVAAGTGAPSLVALARGFRVWSSDARPESAWQRRASARASFGGDDAEPLSRFFTPVVDLTDESTWPADRPRGTFEVVLMSGSFPPRGAHATRRKLCRGFRRLLLRHVAPRGVGLFARHVGRDPFSADDGDVPCWAPDEAFEVALHRQDPEGSWHTRCLSSWTQDVAAAVEELCEHRCLTLFSLHRRGDGLRCGRDLRRRR